MRDNGCGATGHRAGRHRKGSGVDNGGIRSQGKDAIRRSNLSAALEMIRRSGRLSRSELIRKLHLSRTTVFELIGQLAELGLVTEDASPEVLGVGRPSYVVSASDNVGAFAVNPESDAITVGLVTLGGQLVERIRHVSPQPPTPARTIEVASSSIADIRSRMPSGFQIAGTGVAVPGQVERATGRVRLAPRLGWGEVDFAARLSTRLGMPVAVENNARLVTLAEHRRGAARGCTDFIYVFAGSGGIGGGIVVNNAVVSGKSGFAGEIGHIRIAQGGGPDFGGLSGTLEALVRRDDLLAVFGIDDASDDELDRLIQDADDDLLRPVATMQLPSLGAALGSLANVFDPQLIVLGGFAGSLFERYPAELRAGIAEVVLPVVGEGLAITPSADAAGKALIGAAELLFAEVVQNPVDFHYVT